MIALFIVLQPLIDIVNNYYESEYELCDSMEEKEDKSQESEFKLFSDAIPTTSLLASYFESNKKSKFPELCFSMYNDVSITVLSPPPEFS